MDTDYFESINFTNPDEYDQAWTICDFLNIDFNEDYDNLRIEFLTEEDFELYKKYKKELYSNMKIIGGPNDGYEYEFSIIKLNYDHYEWVASFEYAEDAYEFAKKDPCYIVAHNVRIPHKRKEVR